MQARPGFGKPSFGPRAYACRIGYCRDMTEEDEIRIIGQLVKDIDAAQKKCVCLKLKLDRISDLLAVAASKISTRLSDAELSGSSARLVEYPPFEEYKKTLQEYLDAVVDRMNLEKSLKQYGINGID